MKTSIAFTVLASAFIVSGIAKADPQSVGMQTERTEFGNVTQASIQASRGDKAIVAIDADINVFICSLHNPTFSTHVGERGYVTAYATGNAVDQYFLFGGCNSVERFESFRFLIPVQADAGDVNHQVVLRVPFVYQGPAEVAVITVDFSVPGAPTVLLKKVPDSR